MMQPVGEQVKAPMAKPLTSNTQHKAPVGEVYGQQFEQDERPGGQQHPPAGEGP